MKAAPTAEEPAPATAPVKSRRKRKRHRRASNLERWDLYGVTVCAAGLAMLGNAAAATRFHYFDLLLSAALAALVTIAGSRGRRWTLIWLAGVAAASSVGSLWVLPAAGALALGVVVAVSRKRSKLLDAVVAALAVQSLFRIPTAGLNGLPTLLATVAIAPLLVSAYKGSSSKIRRATRLSALGLCAFCGAAVAIAGVAALVARPSLERGSASGKEGLDALGRGDQQAAVIAFDAAGKEFDNASTWANGPWMWPSWVLPGVAPQTVALGALAESGASVSTASATTARVAPYSELKMVSGAIDVSRIAGMEDPVQRQADSVRRGANRLEAVQSSWLVAPLARPVDDFASALHAAEPTTRLAADLVRVTPNMLGLSSARRYLVLVSDSAEARFSGGVLVAYGEVTANDGRLTMTKWGPISDLAANATGPGIDDQSNRGFAERYDRFAPQENPENLSASPDAPTNLRVISDRYSRAGGASLDGVITVDPVGLAAVLTLTGPVDVPGAPAPLNGTNAAQFLLTGQFVAGSSADGALIDAAGRATTEAVLRRELPTPSAIGRDLSVVAEAGHLQINVFDEETQKILDSVHVTNRFPTGDRSDYFSVRVANDSGNKVDAYLSRKVRYEATYDPTTGTVDAVATVTLTNAPPTDVLTSAALTAPGQPPGTSAAFVSFYSPLELRAIDRDGSPLPVEPQREFAGNVYSAKIAIAPGATTVVRLRIAGAIKPNHTYHLVLSNQPSSLPQQATVHVSGTDGWTVDGLDAVDRSVTITGPQDVSARFSRR